MIDPISNTRHPRVHARHSPQTNLTQPTAMSNMARIQAPGRRQPRTAGGAGGCRMEVFEGNPFGKWVWANVWKLPFFKLGAPGQSPTLFGDSANIFRTNIEQASAFDDGDFRQSFVVSCGRSECLNVPL